MTQAIANKKEGNLTQRFRWKDRTDNYYSIDEMETRHLFFTLRMIWNHTMPPDARIQPFRRYEFSSFYTKEYLQTALKQIIPELFSRGDIKPAWQNDINTMYDYYITRLANLKTKKALPSCTHDTKLL